MNLVEVVLREGRFRELKDMCFLFGSLVILLWFLGD